MRKTFIYIFFLVFSSLIFINCSDPVNNNGNGGDSTDNPRPSISSISPNAKVTHAPAFTLSVKGQNFVQGAEIVFNGNSKSTTFVSAAELTCEITPANTLIGAGSKSGVALADTKIEIRVNNPTPGGGDSDPVNLTVLENFRFTDPVNIADGFDPKDPNILLDQSGNVFIAWAASLPGGGFLYLSQSADLGDTWDTPSKITKTKVHNPYLPKLEIDRDNNLHLAYVQGSSSIPFYQTSSNAGISWSNPLSLPGNSWGNGCTFLTYRTTLDLKVSNTGDIGCVFLGEGVGCPDGAITGEFKWSENGGTSWASDDGFVTGFSKPKIFLTSTGTILVFNLDHHHLGIASSVNNGLSWQLKTNFADLQHSGYHDYDISGNSSDNIFLVCIANQGNQTVNKLYFTRSLDGGETWINMKDLSSYLSDLAIDGEYWDKGIPQNNGQREFCNIVVDEADNVHILFRSNKNFYFIRSIDKGKAWTEPVRISIGHISNNASMKMDRDGNLYLTWVENDSPNHTLNFIKNRY